MLKFIFSDFCNHETVLAVSVFVYQLGSKLTTKHINSLENEHLKNMVRETAAHILLVFFKSQDKFLYALYVRENQPCCFW